MKIEIQYKDLKLIDYQKAWQLQHQLFNAAIEDKQNHRTAQNILLLCEHSPVITIGKNGKATNLLFPDQYYSNRGIAVFRIERGGDVTFHGPGQLVVYPVFDLENFNIGLRRYIELLEEVTIRFLAQYGLSAARLSGAAGVWLDIDKPDSVRKIAAVGVKSSRYVTMHGLALNLNTDLNFFNLINPCGFTDKGVTSLQKELNRLIDMEEAKVKIFELFCELFPAG